jgi:hypothetical protein
MTYLNQLRAIKCFLEQSAMMDSATVVPHNMDYGFRVPSVKNVENH